jgi:hypothetical protein
MKLKIVNTIPGRKAKDMASEKKLQKAPEEIEKADENLPETAKPESRENPDDKKWKAEARKKFEAQVRGKLRHSR